MPPTRHRIQLGDVVSFRHKGHPALGVVTSLASGPHVQHIVSTPLGLMRAHLRCSTPARVSRSRVAAPRWVKEEGCVRDPLPLGCDSCRHRDERRRRRRVVFLPDGSGVEHRGVAYHPGELVFRRSEAQGEPWGVGVAREFSAHGVEVQLCGRLKARGGFEDELYLTPVTQTWAYPELAGKGALNVPAHLATSLPRFTLAHRLAAGAIVPLQRPRQPCACILAEARRTTALAALRPPAADLYAGGGGSALGLSGQFELALAVDTEGSCVDTLRANFPHATVLQREVGGLGARDVGEVALLVAGPPCQAFTRANHHRARDARGYEVARLVRVVSRCRPSLVLIESVPGIKDARGSADVRWNAAEDAVRSLLGSGYQVRWAVLDAAGYGAPQYRRRLFVLGARAGTPLPRFPEPTHASARPPRTLFLGESCAHDGTGAFPPTTAEDAAGDLPAWGYELGGTFDPLRTEVGLRRCAVGPPRSRYAERLQRPDRQAREHLTAGCSLDDYEKQLSLLERRRFQGFPDNYKLKGPLEAREQMVGNAIHVGLMAALAGQIKRDAFADFVVD